MENIKKIVVASNNKNKIREIKEILGNEIEIITMEEAGCVGEAVEDGSTYIENAVIKVDFCYDQLVTLGYDFSNTALLAEDSGFEVSALNNDPGIYSARYLGKEATSKERNESIINSLKDSECRVCKYIAFGAFKLPDSSIKIAIGSLTGEVALEEKGSNGFAYDTIFNVNGITVAEMESKDKNEIAHRRKMLDEVRNFIEEFNSVSE